MSKSVDPLVTRFRKRRRRWPVDTAPGSLAVDPQAAKSQIRLIAYGPTTFEEKPIASVSEIAAFLNQHAVVWVDIAGLGDVQVLRDVETMFHLHPLAMEDVVHVHQRSKVDSYPEQLFVVARMVNPSSELDLEQLSMFLGKTCLITFQERAGDCFDPVRDRIRKSRGPIRSLGADYLMYSLLDRLIDSYFPILESYGEKLDVLEDVCLSKEMGRAGNLKDLHRNKRELFAIRRAVWPLREALGTLAREESPFIHAETRLHLRDAYDHTVHLVNLLETYRELCMDLMDLYISMTANRANEVMRVLTIISTIFIPMTFISSIYGMNFLHMPELHWKWGYAWAIGVMASIAVGFLIWFYRKGWLKSFMSDQP